MRINKWILVIISIKIIVMNLLNLLYLVDRKILLLNDELEEILIPERQQLINKYREALKERKEENEKCCQEVDKEWW